MQLKLRNKKGAAVVMSAALAGTLAATSLAVGHDSSREIERIAPREQTIVVRAHPKGVLVDHGSHFAWRINGDEGVSFR